MGVLLSGVSNLPLWYRMGQRRLAGGWRNKDLHQTFMALIMRGVTNEMIDRQGQTTLAMQLLHKCLTDGRIEPETVAILRKVFRQFPDQISDDGGRPMDVVAREILARRDAIMAAVDFDLEGRSIRHASQSLWIDRKNIRKWRKDPEFQILVKKYYEEYVAEKANCEPGRDD